jgi:hypothetical protein
MAERVQYTVLCSCGWHEQFDSFGAAEHGATVHLFTEGTHDQMLCLRPSSHNPNASVVAFEFQARKDNVAAEVKGE